MTGNRRARGKTGVQSNSGASPGKPVVCKLLVGVLVFLLALWALVHFSLWYRQKTGDALSLIIPAAAALSLAWKTIREPVMNLGKAILTHLENMRRGWIVLLAVNLLAVVLIAISNSVYVQGRQAESKEADPEEFRFVIHEEGKPALPAAKVSRDEPLFFKFTPNWTFRKRELSLDIVEPDYKPVEKVLRPGFSVRFRVPPNPEELYVIRLVPGQKLWPNLAPPSFPKPSRCELHITVSPNDDARIEQKKINLRQSLTYIGAGREEDLKAAAEAQPDAEWKPDFCRRMEESTTQPVNCEAHLLLSADPQYEEVAIGKDDLVSFRLICSSRDGRKRREIQIEETAKMIEPDVRTIYLPAPS